MNPKIKRYLFTAGAGLIISVILLFTGGILKTDTAKNAFRIISDACFVPSALLIGYGLLCLCRRGGAFDGLSYSFRTLMHTKKPIKDDTPDESFYSYQKRKQESRTKAPILHFFIVGGFFLLLTIVFSVLFESV